MNTFLGPECSVFRGSGRAVRVENDSSQGTAGVSSDPFWRYKAVGFLFLLVVGLQADDWPQWRGPNRDGVWHETNTIPVFPPNGLRISWRVPVGRGWSSPIVAMDRVYLPGLDEDALASGRPAPVPAEELHRARELFAGSARAVLAKCTPRARPGIALACGVYRLILRRIERAGHA